MNGEHCILGQVARQPPFVMVRHLYKKRRLIWVNISLKYSLEPYIVCNYTLMINEFLNSFIFTAASLTFFLRQDHGP